jgi:hypothetical protein
MTQTRALTNNELSFVTGAGCYTPPPVVCAPPPPPACPPAKAKGNNGFGNGGHDGVPGKSGKTDSNR